MWETSVIIWTIKLAPTVTLRWLSRLAKQRFLLFFVQQKISKRYPWQTEVFAYVISRKRNANQENQLHNDAFHGNTSQPSKNELDPAKIKVCPKCYICPFCRKAFNYNDKVFLFVSRCGHLWWRSPHFDCILLVFIFTYA